MAGRQGVNFCRSEQISVCTAESVKAQSVCRYFVKASRSERCMYFVFGEYCDCLGAQIGAGARRTEASERMAFG